MKVTDEMFYEALQILWKTDATESQVREALEAALADVPEHPEGIALECFREEHRARERAEAKLAKVREWMGDGAKVRALMDEGADVSYIINRELRIILDGK